MDYDMKGFVKVDNTRGTRSGGGGSTPLIGATISKKKDSIFLGTLIYDVSKGKDPKSANLYHDQNTKRFAIEVLQDETGDYRITSGNSRGTSGRIGCTSFIKQLNIERGFYNGKIVENNKIICDYGQTPTIRKE